MEKRGFTEQQAAVYIGMSRAFLRQDRMNGFRENKSRGPAFIRFGRNIRYLKEHLDAWLEKYIVERNLPDWMKE